MVNDENARRTIKTESITRADRLRIVADSYCDERTVAACYNGAANVRASTYRRVLESARRLRLPRPPEPGKVA